MKTHDLAKALGQLSKLLKSLPNQDVSKLSEGSIAGRAPLEANSSNVGVSLSVLASLSKYEKSDWQRVIHDFKLPIEIRPRDASRDIMGKIIAYLAENERERQRVARESAQGIQGGSELSSALKFLLSNG